MVHGEVTCGLPGEYNSAARLSKHDSRCDSDACTTRYSGLRAQTPMYGPIALICWSPAST